MSSSRTPSFRHLALSIHLALACATSAVAAGAPQRFDIGAGSLDQALNQLALEAGIDLSIDSQLTRGIDSPGLHGEYSIEQGLGQLLAGSGLVAVRQGNGGYRLETLESGIDLGATNITGPRNPRFDVYSAPRATVSVDREQLDRIPQTSSSEMFRGIPGLQMANAYSGNGFDPNIRGLQGNGRVKVLFDGTDTTQTSHLAYTSLRSHNYVDPDFIAGIDVEKGPDLANGALGGSIAMRSFDAGDLIVNPERTWGIRLRGMLGDNGGDLNGAQACQMTRTSNGQTSITGISASNRANCLGGLTAGNYSYRMIPLSNDVEVPDGDRSASLLGAWRPSERVDLVAGYSRRRSGNYSSGARGSLGSDYPSNGGYYFDASPKDSFSYWQPGEEVYGTFTDNESWLGKLGLNFSEHRLEFRYNQFDSRYVLHRNASSQLIRTFEGYFPLDSHTRQERYGLEHTWRPANPLVDLKAELWGARTEEDNYTNGSGSSTGNTGNEAHVETSTFGGGLANSSHLSLLTRDLLVKVGGQFKREEIDSNNSVDGTRFTQYGLYAQATLEATDWLSLDGGLRHDGYDVSVKSNRARENDDRNLSFQGGLTLSPSAWLQLFTRYSEGWRAPSTRENTSGNCALGYAPVVISGVTYYSCRGEGLLKPERSENLEYGLNIHGAGLLFDADQLGIKLSRFDNRIKDYIFGTGTSFILPYENIDRANMRGYELAMNYDNGWGFFEYAFTRYDRMEYCGFGNPQMQGCLSMDGSGSLYGMNTPAERQHNATLGVRLLDRRLTFGTSLTHASGTNWDYDGMRQYTVIDLFGSYRWQSVELGLSVRNLRDHYYFEAGTGAEWPIPAPGRTVRGTLTLSF